VGTGVGGWLPLVGTGERVTRGKIGMELAVGSASQVVSRGGSRPGTPPAEIQFLHVTKRYPGQVEPAISNLTFTVPAGTICCLVGPSGGGKTTAMKLVNRLIDLTEGDILIGGKSIMTVDPTILRREIGYVIQQVGLFPHMTIAENVAVLPKLLKWPKRQTAERVAELLELVGLGRGYAERYPAQLSGGQQQRVGLARALAVDPPVMLMDEPFGALDPITRSRIQDEFLRLQEEIRKTVIFVTHDIDEAIKMGDRIAVLREGGVLAQFATADELLGSPADEYVARFVGADRSLKRLSLRRVSELEGCLGTAPSRPDVAFIDESATLRVALSMLFDLNVSELGICRNGEICGRVTLDQLQAALSDSSSSAMVPSGAGRPRV